jgi:hypothetical protein
MAGYFLATQNTEKNLQQLSLAALMWQIAGQLTQSLIKVSNK